VGSIVGESVGSIVGESVGSIVGESVGSIVGESVGSIVGGSVGSIVGGSVGSIVGGSVGSIVGESVGSIVGGSVLLQPVSSPHVALQVSAILDWPQLFAIVLELQVTAVEPPRKNSSCESVHSSSPHAEHATGQ